MWRFREVKIVVRVSKGSDSGPFNSLYNSTDNPRKFARIKIHGRIQFLHDSGSSRGSVRSLWAHRYLSEWSTCRKGNSKCFGVGRIPGWNKRYSSSTVLCFNLSGNGIFDSFHLSRLITRSRSPESCHARSSDQGQPSQSTSQLLA